MHVSALLLLGPAAVLAFPSLQRRQDINVDRMLESRQDLDYTQWSRPGPGDVRGPCPAMNSLANHGFLPRNGKDITLGMLQKVLPAAVNVGADLADVFYAGTIGMGLTHLNGKFDLDALNKHNAIEHDGSLSRADASTGDNFSFNQTIFDSYMAFYDGVAEANPELAGKARMARIKTEQARDPKFKYGPKAQLISNGETALILGVFGDVETGIAPVEFIRIWFEQERLPYLEGWRRPEKPSNILTIVPLIAKSLIASGEILQEGQTVTESSVKNAMAWLLTHLNDD